MALRNSSFKNYVKANYCRGYAINIHSCVFLILPLSALPGVNTLKSLKGLDRKSI